MIKNARHLFFLGVFSVMVVQPQHFVVDVPFGSQSLDSVHASYAQLIEQTQQQDGVLIYDTVSVDEDRQTSISYQVAPGDNLSSIARDFGTTIGTLIQANDLRVNSTLRPGQKLIIAYTDHYVYSVIGVPTLEQFAEQYNLNKDDLMSLNYIDTPGKQLEEGQELVIPLTRREAQVKGLVTPEEFIPLALETEIVADGEIYAESLEDPASTSKEDKQLETFIPRNSEQRQVVITPEQTEQHLKNIDQQAREAVVKSEAERIAKEEARQAAETVSIQETKPEMKAPIISEAAIDPSATCNESQCYHDGRCRSKPKNAVCVPQDPTNAWICKEGFVDTGKSCVKPSEEIKEEVTPQGEKQIAKGVIKQRYFNTKKSGFKTNGRAPGNCTDYVNLRLQQNINKETRRRGNAKYRYGSASKAGASVGQQPKYGSIVVFNNGIGASRWAGHVAVVLEVASNGTILIEEGNYVGLYIASQRRVSIDDKSIVGYIYP